MMNSKDLQQHKNRAVKKAQAIVSKKLTVPTLIAKGIPLAKDSRLRKDRILGVDWAKTKGLLTAPEGSDER